MILLFEKTEKIILECEIELINIKKSYEKLDWYDRNLFLPMKFLLVGAKDFFITYIKTFVILLVSILLVSISNIIIEADFKTNFIIIMSFFILGIFSTPSQYAFYEIKSTHIVNILNVLNKHNICNIKELELLENNLKKINDRVNMRIKALRWFVGATWLLFTFFHNILPKYLGQEIELIKKLDLFQYEINMISIGIVTIICISIYSRGMNFLFKGIEFAINEKKLSLEENKI